MRTIELTKSEMEDSNKALIIFSNSIAQARYSLSMPTQKLLLFLISKITYEERKQGVFLNTLEFSLNEIKLLLAQTGREKSNDDKEVLTKAIDELHKNYIKKLVINDRGQETYETWSWSQYSKFDEEKGIFIFKFNQEVAPLLLELKSYFKSNFIEYLKLSSKHSIKLYHLLRATDFFKNKISFLLDDFKKQLQVENKYNDWGNFKKRVLDPSFIELNKETNYFFEYETERIGLQIGRIHIFSFDKSDDRACTRYVRKQIDEFLKKNKIQSDIRDIFSSLSFSFDKEKEIVYIRFKDKDALGDFMAKNRNKIKTENDAYKLMDKGFKSYKVNEVLKSLFRNQTNYRYSSVYYVKPKVEKKSAVKTKSTKEEGFLNMGALEKLAKEVQQENQSNDENLKSIKQFGITTENARKIFLAEGNEKISERVKKIIAKGIAFYDVPKELIKEYEKENIL